jgi:hypothetical protein
MYCSLDSGTEIDHFWPKAHYPFNAFSWPNYLWSCSACNSTYKRNNFPLDSTGQPLLIDPTNTDPHLHLAFAPSTGRFSGQTPQGVATILTLGLNQNTRPDRRLDNFQALQSHLAAYDDACIRKDLDKANLSKRIVVNMPCAFLLSWLIQYWQRDAFQGVISIPCRLALRNRPEIATW